MKAPSTRRGGWPSSAAHHLLLLLAASAPSAASPQLPLLSFSSSSSSSSSALSARGDALSIAAATEGVPACDNIVVDKHKYNLQPLAGPHTVVTYEYAKPTHFNTTYTLDLCGGLKSEGGKEEERCRDGTRVCAITHRWDPKEHKATAVERVIPIVGGDEKGMTWEATRLAAEGEGDKKKKEGLRLTLTGAATYQQRKQRVVIELRCDSDKLGTEGEWESIDKYKPHDGKLRRRDDKKGDPPKTSNPDESTPEQQLKKDGAALLWNGYRRDKDGDVERDTLYLTWYTKHVCDAAAEQPPASPPEGGNESKHWGFFTWFYVILFLGIAAYLVFGAWLNYNLHGARGWDLIPHSDVIRDLPFLMRDLVRSLLNTLQSSGTRGGYSAV
ncbi:hypothetical protein VTJ83DRAFT_6273 [Remersonia thermophila]|uniref:Autophagy-related protein 27 n=1 Tax=Remersonia thermophila TaxID=72144 RepID=A0ABR4D4A3_9PEZI